MAATRGLHHEAAARLREAAAGFEAAGMQLCAAAARHRLGALVGGDEGHTLIRESEAWMTDQTIRDPVRMTALFAPGFPGREP